MLCITNEDVELIRTFTLSLKMKNHEKIVEHFKNKYEQYPENTVNAFNYGICMSIYVAIDPNDTDKAKHLSALNEAFSACLRHTPGWWLPRYLRSGINDGVPDEVIRETDEEQFSIFKKADPAEDRKILIEQQKSCPGQFSYFLCPYIAESRAFIRQGKIDEAKQAFKEGLAAVPMEKSPYTLSYLTKPFYDAILLFRKLEETGTADEIKKIALTLFPGAKNLHMV